MRNGHVNEDQPEARIVDQSLSRTENVLVVLAQRLIVRPLVAHQFDTGGKGQAFARILPTGLTAGKTAEELSCDGLAEGPVATVEHVIQNAAIGVVPPGDTCSPALTLRRSKDRRVLVEVLPWRIGAVT